MTDIKGAQDQGAGGGRRRLEAILALATGALALLAVLAFMLDSFANFLVALVGAGVAVTGGWVLAANRGTARVVGGVVAALGVGVLVVAFLNAGRSLWALLLAVALGAASAYFARRATRRQVAAVSAADLGTPRPPAERPVLIMNPKSGGGKVERFNLVAECTARGIEPVVLSMGDDMVQLAEDAVARGADVIGMAGGDGSQALVATVASEARAPARRDPGRDPQPPGAGPRPGPRRRGRCAGCLQLAASPGRSTWRPSTVGSSSTTPRWASTRRSLPPSPTATPSCAPRWTPCRTCSGENADSLDLHFVDDNGAAHDTADVVLVSNNPYVLDSLGGVGTRARMDTGALGVVSLTITSAMDARRFLALETAGQVRKFPRMAGVEHAPVRDHVQRPGAGRRRRRGADDGVPGRVRDPPGRADGAAPAHAPGRSPAARRALREHTPGAVGHCPRTQLSRTPAPGQALRRPGGRCVGCGRGNTCGGPVTPRAVRRVMLGHRQCRGGDLQQRPGGPDTAGAVARGRACHHLDDRARLRSGPHVQDLGGRDVGVPGQDDVDLGIHQRLLEVVATGQGLQVIRARRVVHRHHPDGPLGCVGEGGADDVGLPLRDAPGLPPPAGHGTESLDAHRAQVQDRVEVLGHLGAELPVGGGHPVQRVGQRHIVVADHDHRRLRELVDDLLGPDELVGSGTHGQVAGHDGRSHPRGVQVLVPGRRG